MELDFGHTEDGTRMEDRRESQNIYLDFDLENTLYCEHYFNCKKQIGIPMTFRQSPPGGDLLNLKINLPVDSPKIRPGDSLRVGGVMVDKRSAKRAKIRNV